VDNNGILRLILIGIAIIVAWVLIKWILGVLSGLLVFAVTAAVIIAVIWLVFTVLTKKQSY
jgi:hypothetical protein